MTIQDFASQVITKLQEEFPQYFHDAEFHVQQVPKPGNLILTGITVRMNQAPITPIYYLDAAHDSGKTVAETANDLVDKIVRNAPMPNPVDTHLIESFEAAQDYIIPRLIDIRPGRNDAYLQNRPVARLKCGTIGVIYDIALPDKSDFASMTIPITYDLQNSWNVSTEELHAAAVENGPRIRPVKLASLSEMLGIPFEADDVAPLTVLTSSVGANGASVILYPETRAMLEERFPNGCCLLPSSVHEWIVVERILAEDISAFVNMVKTINANEVLPEDRLADDVFMLDAEGQLVSAI